MKTQAKPTAYARRRQNWPRPWSSKRLPWTKLAPEEIRSFIGQGWRVRQMGSGLYVPVQ